MKPIHRARAGWIVAVFAALVLVAACSSKDGGDEVAVPKGFDLPAGVALTKGGSTLAVGDPASVVYQVGKKAASAITVTVTAIDKGAIADFRFFSLDEASKASTPYYVRLTVRNDGPAGLGGAALPVFAHDSTNTVFPPNELVGTFEPCPSSTLPESFLPEASAQLCLVYLVPKDHTLETVDLQTGAEADAISWKP